MVQSVRRFLVFQVFLLWQGGFLFYSAVVVPVGTDIHGAREQGLVTQEVTNWLNLAGAAWAAAFLWDVVATPDPNRLRRRVRWAGWLVCVALLAVLVGLHVELDKLVDSGGRRWFLIVHGAYLWISTAQWVLGLVLAWTTLRAWSTESVPRAADRSSG
ncbi:hypothetical protein [Fimbriiglobus ruber]|uniref:DUF4149 domain-containing protein n=1 Tax=Fimbriiglobus ruber TaxID=1908690 RepID=A0A225DNM8_9BACT|nr:hypothetical protein [Fimbriiglobus ruber]OWK43002.1 hypothetical protein FRUB_02601 [Fimbriiglobus ruber]